jgi:subtilase family serine protease
MQKILNFLVAFSLLNCSQSSGILHRDQPLIPSTENSDVQSGTHVFQESMPYLASRSDIVKQTSLLPTHVHEVVFAVQQKNIDVLERMLNDVSDPDSANYGQHLSGEQVAALTMNPEARDAIVNYLHANGASVTAESLNSDFITASAPISQWNMVFNTKFNLFHQKQVDGEIEQLVRAGSYSIPKELEQHVMTVMNTIEMPVVRMRQANIYDAPKEVISGMGRNLGTTYSLGWILPKVLRGYYNVTNNKGSNASTQAAYGSNSDFFNPADLAMFQKFDNVNIHQPVMNVNGHSTSNKADLGIDGDWGEGNLDIQYIVAMSRGSPTTYWYWSRTLASWLVSLSTIVNVPLVLSVSYGADEFYTSNGESRVFNAEAIKLGIRGITILAASGDDGALSDLARGRPGNCAYRPIFPASNPYVVAVGATSV